MVHHKLSKLLNNSTVSEFVQRRWNEVNDLLGGQYCVNKKGLKGSWRHQCK